MSEHALSASPLDRTWPAVPEAVGDLRRAVVEFARSAGGAGEALASVRLAVSEAATNVVLHAYPDEAAGDIHVHAECEGDRLRVVVSDEGAGMAPRPDSPGLGLGLPLIAQIADNLEVSRCDGGGTSVCMRFILV